VAEVARDEDCADGQQRICMVSFKPAGNAPTAFTTEPFAQPDSGR
jgi:hypothetical protein